MLGQKNVQNFVVFWSLGELGILLSILLSFNRVKALVCALTFYSNRSDHTVPF